MVNDVTIAYSYNYKEIVSQVNVNPAMVLYLNKGDRVRVKNPYTQSGTIRGDASIMYTWFSMTLLYADD